MSNPWHSLFLKASSPDNVAADLRGAFTASAWSVYDPFPGGTGTPFAFNTFQKIFVLPAQDDLIRLVSERAIPSDVVARAFPDRPALRGWLLPDEGGWEVLNSPANGLERFGPFLRPGRTLAELERALTGNAPVSTVTQAGTLPPEIEQLAKDRNVSAKQTESLMEKMTGSVFGRFAGGAKNDAQAFLTGGIDWNSAGGRAVRAAADLLTLPSAWRDPGYVQVKDAFQAMRALQRNPKATLTSSEKEALAALPAASDFQIVFVGKAE